MPLRTALRRTIAGLDVRIDRRPADGATGCRPPLLLCSGLGAGSDMFDPLLGALDPDVDVIRFDSPGIGNAPASPLPLSFPQLARALHTVLDELGHPKVDVLGYSWGGALTQQFALQHSRRCRRLVLISTSPGVISVPGDLKLLYSMLVPPGQPAPGHKDMLKKLLAGTDSAQRRELRTMLQISRAATGAGYLHQLAALGMWTSLPFLPLISQPVLVLSGTKDPIVPVANARLMRALIPGAQLVTFPGGHGQIITGAGLLAPHITGFLQQPSGRR